MKKFFTDKNYIYTIIAILHFLTTFFTDKLIFTKIDSENIWTYCLVKFLTLIVLILFWQGIKYLVSGVNENNKNIKVFTKYFCISLIINLILLTVTWAGIWNPFEYNIFNLAKTLGFESLPIALCYAVSLSIIPFPAASSIIAILFLSIINGLIIVKISRVYKPKHIWPILVPLVFFPTTLKNLYGLNLPLKNQFELLLVTFLLFLYYNRPDSQKHTNPIEFAKYLFNKLKKKLKDERLTRHNFTAIALFHYFTTFYTDKIIFKSIILDTLGTYIVVKLFTLAALLAFWNGIGYLIQKIKIEDSNAKIFLKYSCIYFAINFIFLLLTWPGMWRCDEFNIYSNSSHLYYFHWQHWLTSLFYMVSLSIIPNSVGIVLIQILCTSIIIGYIIAKFNDTYKPKYIWPILLPLIFPTVISSNLYPMRLTLYTYLELLLFSLIIFKYSSKTEISIKNAALTGVLTSIITTLRAESIILVPVIPILLCYLFYKKIDYKKVIAYLLVFSSLFILITKVQDNGMKNEEKIKYTVTGLFQFLDYYFVTGNFISNTREKDMRELNKIIDVNKMKKGGINAFWIGKSIKSTSKKDLETIKFLEMKLILLNTPGILQKTFKNSLLPNVFIVDPGREDVFKENYKYGYNDKEFKNKPFNNKSRMKIVHFLDCNKKYYEYPPRISSRIFHSIIPAYVIFTILFAIGVIKRFRPFIIIPPVLIVKTLLIVATVPSNLFMYFFPFYLNSYMLGIMTFLQLFRKAENKL